MCCIRIPFWLLSDRSPARFSRIYRSCLSCRAFFCFFGREKTWSLKPEKIRSLSRSSYSYFFPVISANSFPARYHGGITEQPWLRVFFPLQSLRSNFLGSCRMTVCQDRGFSALLAIVTSQLYYQDDLNHPLGWLVLFSETLVKNLSQFCFN